jgi:hypothetical protein
MTEDEEAEEIIRRLKAPPKRRGAEDVGYFYCPYIPLMVTGDGIKFMREITDKINEVTGIPAGIITRYDKKEE